MTFRGAVTRCATLLRRWFIPFLVALFLLLMWRNQAQAMAFWRVLQSARRVPLALAVLLQIGTAVNQPALFQSLYALVGIETTWREVAPPVLAGRFINVAAPAGGLGETALLFEQARRRGWDLSRITLVTTLYFALNFAVFALILLFSFAFLAAHQDLQGFEIVAAAPILLGLLACALLFRQIVRSPDFLSVILSAWTSKIVARWPRGKGTHRRAALAASTQKIGETMRRFSLVLHGLQLLRGLWARPLLHAVLVDALEIGVLTACFRAFDVPVSPTTVLASYAIATLFTVVSLTPQGIGVVEGALGATLISLGVALPHASAIVLLYRGFSFWLPLLVGLVATRWWSKTLAQSDSNSTSAPIIVAPPQ